MGELLKIFACAITEWAKDEDTTNEADKANDDDSIVTVEAEDAKTKPGRAEQAAAKTAYAKTLTTIADD